MIIGVLGGKGGTSKSTISRAIATALQSAKRKVTGFDTDGEQASFNRWNQRRKKTGLKAEITVRMVDPSNIKRELNGLAFDVAVVDGGAYVTSYSVEIAECSDLVVVPCGYGKDETGSAIRILRGMEQKGVPRKRFAIVFSKVSDSVALQRETRKAFEDAGYWVAPGYIPTRDSYIAAMDKGYSICEVIAPRLQAQARMVIHSLIDRAKELTSG